MSLDLVKNALYQAIASAIPGLKVYPEHVDNTYETFPNLAFLDVKEEHLGARLGYETVQLANPAYPATDQHPWLIAKVIGRFRSHLRLQLRDSLGSGTKDKAAYQKVRDQHNAVVRFLATTRTISVGTPLVTLAELWFEGDNTRYDPSASIFLSEFDLRVDPWRLLDVPAGLPTYAANTIELDVVRSADSRLLITRMYPLA